MPMNFWEAQREARKKTFWYLILFALLTIAIAILLEWAMRHFAGNQYQPPYPLLGALFVLITFGVAGFQYLMFRSYGGSYVAESVGAHLVSPQTKQPSERQLLNIVEEIAIASSLPIPPVYIIPAQEINAFAAGLSPETAVVAVTYGSLQKLSRDEIQGVIAHEFGHIRNGDMRISMRLAAMIMGFFFILYFAFRLLQIAGISGGRRSDDGDKRGGNPIALAALLLMAAGVITWFAGSILKAAISRQREYLADASSVQFTRNPTGLANALRKIEASSKQDMPREGMAFSHMYFNDRSFFSTLFATHPPVEKRIAAIEGKISDN